MDKAEFIEKAPPWYALAIVSHIVNVTGAVPVTKFELIDGFSHYDDDARETYQRIEPGLLFETAIKLLIAEKLINLERDDFAPDLIIPSDSLTDDLSNGFTALSLLYDKYRRAGVKRDAWLREALDKIYQEYRRLGVQDTDFDNPEAEWSPIPVDRELPETQAVIAAVEDAAEKLRSDNGYAAEKPEERRYVLDGLTSFLKQMKEARSVSLPYVRRYALETLARAAKSFGKSATGLVLDVAKTELKNWLLKVGIPWPSDWL